MDFSSSYERYCNCIYNSLDKNITEWDFKANPYYRGILEHVDKKQAYEYLDEIKNHFTEFYNNNKDLLISLSHKNDLYGNTIKEDFYDFTICSPTNLRYILHSLLILDYMKDNNLNNLNIIEIGGGYGGLCFFIKSLASYFNLIIDSYIIYDLEAPVKLQKKYLEALEITNTDSFILDETTVEQLNKNSFLISNYSLSEFTTEISRKYSSMVINPYCSHGFLTWNFFNETYYNFIDNKEIKIIDEYPFTGNKVNNKYIYFKPSN